MSDANRTTLAFIEEVTFGVTPNTPTLQRIRTTGESLMHAKATVISEEIEPSRQTADMLKVGASATGDIKAELNYTDFQTFLAAALFNANPVALAFAGTASINHTTGVVTGSPGDFTNAVVGASYRIAGSVPTGNNGIKRVIAKAANGSTLTFDAGSFTGTTSSEAITIAGKAVANGTTKRTFAIERKVAKSSSGTICQVFNGMAIDTLGLAIESQKIVNLTFGFMGKISSVADNTIASAETAPSTDSPINGTNNVGAITIDGTATSERFKSFTLNLKNNLRPQDALGQEGAFDLGVGRFEVTGSASVYLENKALIADMIAHTARAFTMTLVDPAGTKSIVINLPRCQFGKADGQAGQINTDIMLNLDFTALKDATTGSTMILSFVD